MADHDFQSFVQAMKQTNTERGIIEYWRDLARELLHDQPDHRFAHLLRDVEPAAAKALAALDEGNVMVLLREFERMLRLHATAQVPEVRAELGRLDGAKSSGNTGKKRMLSRIVCAIAAEIGSWDREEIVSYWRRYSSLIQVENEATGAADKYELWAEQSERMGDLADPPSTVRFHHRGGAETHDAVVKAIGRNAPKRAK